MENVPCKLDDPPGSDIEFSILSSYGTVLCNIDKDLALSGYNITDCAGRDNTIKLHADLNTVSFVKTPKLFEWGVTYKTEIKSLTVDVGQNYFPVYKNNTEGNIVISDNNTSPKLSDEINNALGTCSCRGCTPSAEYCDIAIRFGSNSSGAIKVQNPYIEYISSR